MIDDSAKIDSRFRMMTVLGLCLISALIGRLVYLANPFDADAAIFIYMGKMTYLGGRMCHDFLDNKFPTVGLMMTVPWRLFGTQWASYVLLSATLGFSTCLILAEYARRTFGKNAGMATLFFSLVYLNFTTVVFGGFQLETCQVFFDVISACFIMECLRTGRCAPAFAAGLAAGCAAMFKPTGLSVVLAFAACRLAFPHPKFKHIFYLAAGLALPLAATLSYLYAADILRDMPALYHQISSYAASSAMGLPNFIKLPIVLLMLAGPIFVRAWLFRRRRINVPSDPAASTLHFFLIAWLTIEIFAVLMQRRMYGYHFLVLVAPAALIFGLIPRRSMAVSMAAAVLPMAIFSIGCASDAFTHLYDGHTTLPTSDYLLAHASPNDRIWDENASRLLLETNLKPASRCILAFLFANTDDSPLIFSKQILSDFQNTPPKYIVLKTSLDRWVFLESHYIWDLNQNPVRQANYYQAWSAINAYVKRNYMPVARINDETIWQRRSPTQPIASVK